MFNETQKLTEKKKPRVTDESIFRADIYTFWPINVSEFWDLISLHSCSILTTEREIRERRILV